MNTPSAAERSYQKFEIDNTVCRRRFHIAFEQGSPIVPQVKIDCPHCGVTIFEAPNHPEVTLLREENLVKSPDGTNPLINECRFLKS